MSYGQRGRKPWSTDNDQALTVNQRASHDWDIGLVVVTASNDGVSKIIGRQPGRATSHCGCRGTGSHRRGVDDDSRGRGTRPDRWRAGNGAGAAVLNVGDSFDVPTEGSFYAGLIPGSPPAMCSTSR